MTKIAFSGHRPNKLPCGYSYENKEALKIIDFIARLLIEKSEKLREPITVISGGALGIDQLVILAVARILEIGKNFKYLPLIIAEPFDGFWTKWPKESQLFYLNILRDCASQIVQIAKPPYAAHKMQQRNKWMVDNADELWYYWDGSDGGTKNCVEYAKKNNKATINLFELLKGIK